MHRIILKRHEDKRITRGHRWVFSNEIDSVSGDPRTGDIVAVVSAAGRFIGCGFYHPHSLIAVRILSHRETGPADGFIRERIGAAFDLRTALFPGCESYRLVHGESDDLPGLIVDRYGDCCSLQILSAGMELHLPAVCDAIQAVLPCRTIVERNESPLRVLEGLEQRKGVIRGEAGPVTITEHGIKYAVDLLEGQKTGFFLDQRENRYAVRRYAAGRDVLDCFCNDGGFALNAAAGGAKSVTGIDISETAVARASGNAAANGFAGNAEFIAADVFEYLKTAGAGGKKFGLVILDPPSFAKNKKTVRNAIRGYRQLHTLALPLIPDGGYLATASCSHHIFEETFRDIIRDAAEAAGRSLTLLEWRGASPDHPTIPAMPETGYLKFGIYRVGAPV